LLDRKQDLALGEGREIALVWTDVRRLAASREAGPAGAAVSSTIQLVKADARISKFVVHGRKRIAGWISRVDAEIFVTTLLDQTQRGAKGDTLEIGVHHGRSFLLQNLCAADDEAAIAVDIFDRQDLNVGHRSGKGDLEKFNTNVARFGDVAKARILQKSSVSLTTDELKTHTAGLRFGHIDGGHSFAVVLNDLRLTAGCAGNDCVIALDDFFNPDFPDVAAAYHEWMRERPGFVPICASKGKLYLCRPGAKQYYFDALLRNDYLRFHFKTRTQLVDHAILLFTGRYSGLRGLVRQYMAYHAPGAFKKLQGRKGALSDVAS
jgi:hypothetical protein